MDSPLLHLGTCSWSEADWRGVFYSPDAKTTDFIIEYGQHFQTVEIDSTFYAVPKQTTVEGWKAKTPGDFIFSAKVPRTITHDKFLVDCQQDLDVFLTTMSLLGRKLGPILFQFPYFAKRTRVTQDDFLERLEPFLSQLPKDEFRFTVEVRNKTWITSSLLDLLGSHGVSLCLIDHPWMWRPNELFERANIITGDFCYIRWLGDRHGIEKITQTWNRTVIDKTARLQQWAKHIGPLLRSGIPVFGYVNNHFSGHSPTDVERLEKLLRSPD